MKLSHKISIDLLDFFRTGRFDCIEPGQSKQWILSNFPDPDDMSEQEALRHDYSIWRYGNIEFHFDRDILFLIFSDYLKTLEGGSSLCLDPWIIKNATSLNLLDVITALNREKIDYSKRSKQNLETVSLVLDSSGVEMHFERIEGLGPDQNQFELSAFALMRRRSDKA